jgi:ATP-dependent exoDNAse (exonuclease V) alpha subunit
MTDTRRLASLIEITRESDSKLVLAGDSAQLSPIGAGGLFAQLKDNVPTAQLSEVHRASHQWERDAWTALRNGDAERALGAYQARDRLHIEETRTDAGGRMVNVGRNTRRPPTATRRDAHRRVQPRTRHAQPASTGRTRERRRAGNADRHAARPALRAARRDEIVFAAQHRIPGQERVENGTRAQVMVANERDSRVLVRTEEPKPRDVEISTREFDELRLAYAQDVHKAQGLTTDRALVLTGGWQTDRETSYVALTRARERTDIYTSREDLGHHGIDTAAIHRLAQRASRSNAQQASISRDQIEPEHDPGRAVRELREALNRDDGREQRHDAEPDRERGSFSEELRKALGRDQPRERGHDRPADAEPESNREAGRGSYVEELRRILEEQRERCAR